MKVSTVAPLALAAVVAAQRPDDMSICDYYTTALLKENNATTQQTVLTLVVNTAVIGNYTQPNVGIAVPGILAPGTGPYEGVNLVPYFSGGLASTNGGDKGVCVNFLDDGGATPLTMNMPANGTMSAQYKLLTHLYSYFASLLGCSEFGNTTAPYKGSTSMYKVHKFMALDAKEIGWFITNVGLSAASFGVADEDVAIVGKALSDAFGYKCSPAVSIPASADPELQAICIEDNCPTSPDATCAAYAPVVEPTVCPTSTMKPMNTSAPMPTGGPAAPTSTGVPFTGEAGALLPILSGAGAAIVGLAAFML